MFLIAERKGIVDGKKRGANAVKRQRAKPNPSTKKGKRRQPKVEIREGMELRGDRAASSNGNQGSGAGRGERKRPLSAKSTPTPLLWKGKKETELEKRRNSRERTMRIKTDGGEQNTSTGRKNRDLRVTAQKEEHCKNEKSTSTGPERTDRDSLSSGRRGTSSTPPQQKKKP